MRWFTVLILAACLAYAACGCSCGSDEKTDEQDDDCIVCKFEDYCYEWLGEGWICEHGCCVVDESYTGDDHDHDCDDNSAPVLLGYGFHHDQNDNGDMDRLIESEPIEFGVGDYASYFIGFAYSDDDCNLPGGDFWSKLTVDGTVEQDWEIDLQPLPEELGCATEESGLLYGINFTPQIGEYELNVYWIDICSAQSNQIDVLWTITP